MSLGGLDGLLGLGPLLGPQPSPTLITNLIPSTSVPTSSGERTIIHESTTSSLLTTPTTATSSIIPSSVSSPIIDTLSDASTTTSTSIATESEAPALGTAQANHHAQPQGFLQNKTLSGFVFVLCGLAGLVLITMVGTWAVRRREKRRLMDEAMIFDSASMIADAHTHNDNPKLESGIRRGVSRSISKRSYKRMSDESFGHVGQGTSNYGGVLPGGDYAGYGIPTLAYASPSAIIQPQYPQAMHLDHQRTYEDEHQLPHYRHGGIGADSPNSRT